MKPFFKRFVVSSEYNIEGLSDIVRRRRHPFQIGFLTIK